MSHPSLTPDAMLARLAAFDMAAAEHAHARFMAADEPADVERLGRTYERAARSLRRTLALQAKLQRDAAVEARRAEMIAERDALLGRRSPAHDAAADDEDQSDPLVDALVERLRAEYDPSEAERLEPELEDFIDHLWTGDFAELSVETQTEAIFAYIRRTVPPKAQAARLADPLAIAPGPVEPEPAIEPGAGALEPAVADPALPAPAPPEAPAAEPDLAAPPPQPPPPEPWPEPYIPPWERLRPGQTFPGGSGW